jgi:hypothetical protein
MFSSGNLLSKSCLPKTETTTPEFFDNPSRTAPSVHSSAEQRIWGALEGLHDTLHTIFKKLLRNKDPSVKHFTLMWIGDCFKSNAGRVLYRGCTFFQGRPIEARILVLNFAANADVTRASDPAGQT